MIAALIAVLLGFSPDVAKPDTLMGTARGLGTAASGFANSALILVAAALFLAAAMTITGLDRRIALAVLSIVFPILGGLRAGEGRLWTYPLSIRFIR